jgi:hypothetical protein
MGGQGTTCVQSDGTAVTVSGGSQGPNGIDGRSGFPGFSGAPSAAGRMTVRLVP